MADGGAKLADFGMDVVVLPGQDLTVRPEASKTICVSIKTPTGSERIPCDICVVLDISGSMGAEATITGASGQTESNGLSLLDVAKHGVRTIISTLCDKDRLSVVSFNHEAVTLFPLTLMNEDGQKIANDKVEALSNCGTTDIWKGLHNGLESLFASQSPERFSHVMLLTDGESCNKEMIVPSLDQYMQSKEGFPGTINTFGFGYNLDSTLLTNLAFKGSGSYSFIPDAGFVGTAFVNTLSNLLVTYAVQAELILEAEGENSLESVGGVYPSIQSSGATRINIGSLQYGQSKDVLVRMKISAPGEYLCGNIQCKLQQCDGRLSFEPFIASTGDIFAESLKVVEHQRHRCNFTQAIQEAVLIAASRNDESLCRAASLLRAVMEEAIVSPAKDEENLAALLQDISGQSSEAFSRMDWYWKWGRHYMPSVMFAHNLQQCNNFKDPGVQVYGKGVLFIEIQEKADDAFNKLPAPKPSVRARTSYTAPGAAGVSPAPRAPVQMSAYNDRYAVCIDGSSVAQMANGRECAVHDLKKGDCLVGLHGSTVEVDCVFRTQCRGGRMGLVQLDGNVRLTPYHPVYVNGGWRFPADLADIEERPCDAVYNFTLRGGSAAIIAGVPCIALAHGVDEGAATHEYFGTERVARDLAKFDGFEKGFVDLTGASVLRNPMTDLVCGLHPAANSDSIQE